MASRSAWATKLLPVRTEGDAFNTDPKYSVSFLFGRLSFCFLANCSALCSNAMALIWKPRGPRAGSTGRIQAALTSKSPPLSEHLQHWSWRGFTRSPRQDAQQWGMKGMKRDVVLLEVTLILTVVCVIIHRWFWTQRLTKDFSQVLVCNQF